MEHESDALKLLGSEIVYDKGPDRYMIYWSTTIQGTFRSGRPMEIAKYNHRLYLYHHHGISKPSAKRGYCTMKDLT
jgi:hypothetical protein